MVRPRKPGRYDHADPQADGQRLEVDIRFYESDLEIEETEYTSTTPRATRRSFAGSDRQLLSRQAAGDDGLRWMPTSMVSGTLVRLGARLPACRMTGNKSSNGFDEGLQQRHRSGSVRQLLPADRGVTRNGVTGQAYNATPYTAARHWSGRFDHMAVFQRAVLS